jgi:hypothetical protein
MGGLDREQMPQIPVQAVVSIFPDGAGVEHDHVGLGAVVSAPVSGALQQAGQPLGIVHVHLAPVGADLEASLLGGAGHALQGRRPAGQQRTAANLNECP